MLDEKKRTSTCSFADEIARISIEEYHRLCPDALLGSYKQTVLSTILCENLDDHSLKILSFGVGTKYMKYHFVDHKTNKLSQQHLKFLHFLSIFCQSTQHHPFTSFLGHWSPETTFLSVALKLHPMEEKLTLITVL
jgi:hypothetical protein